MVIGVSRGRLRAGALLGLVLGAAVATAGFMVPEAWIQFGPGRVQLGTVGELCRSPAGAIASAFSARIAASCSHAGVLLDVATGARVLGGLVEIAAAGLLAWLWLTRDRPGLYVLPPAPEGWHGHGPDDHRAA